MPSDREKGCNGKPIKNNINITNDNRGGEHAKTTPQTPGGRHLSQMRPSQKTRHTDEGKKETKEATEGTDPAGTKKEKSNQKQLSYEDDRKTLIKMENGMRAMNVSILNPTSAEDGEMHRDIAREIKRRKLQIASIQDTHTSRRAETTY